MQKGDAALRELIDDCKPLFEFVITTAIARFDLDTVEGRISAVRAAAEVLTDIRDQGSLRHYYRFVAGRIGVDIDEVESAVRTARRAPKQNRQGTPVRQGAEPARTAYGQEQGPAAASAGETEGDRIEYVYDERPDVSNLSAPISPARL